ncbi:hypothetical protein ACQJBY_013770 [Aegilops geniculata]
MELAKFSPPQIKRIVRAASLEREVVDALMLVKKFGPDVREGRRRQYNYIGSLLRGAQPELMEDLIHSLKNGDESRIQALLSEVADKSMPIEDEEVGELPHEEEGEENQDYMEIADRWFEGLVCQDIPVTNEVYAIHNVEFDRQLGGKAFNSNNGGKPGCCGDASHGCSLTAWEGDNTASSSNGGAPRSCIDSTASSLSSSAADVGEDDPILS